MDAQSEMSVRHALETWRSHQRTDGCLSGVLVVASAIPTLRFVLAPSADSALVMGVFLFALGMACMRLLNSASMVVRIRESFYPNSLSNVVEAEILDVYEHPGALGAPVSTQSTNALWLAPSSNHLLLPDPQLDFPSQLLRIGPGTYCRARNLDGR